MVDVRPHAAQHERAEELPLITDGATVTAVRPLDENRVDEVEQAVLDRLRGGGNGDLADAVAERGGEGVDWERLASLRSDTDLDAELRSTLSTLRDRYERPYPSLVTIRFDPDTDVEFLPGQYVTVRYDGVPRPYSVASSPREDEIGVCVGRVPGGKLSSKLCGDVSVDDRAVLRGPNGDFVLRQPSDRDVAFLATGTGVAPLKSMIEYLFEASWDRYDGSRRNVWLFLGAGWEDDLPYRDRFRELAAEHEQFHFVPSLTREGLIAEWNGETDYVQRVLVKYLSDDAEMSGLDGDLASCLDRTPDTDVDARIDPGNLEVYACGINAMVNAVVEAVEGLGVPEERIDAEGYG